MRNQITDNYYISCSKLKKLLSSYGNCDAFPNGETYACEVNDLL